jgi:plastocyanin
MALRLTPTVVVCAIGAAVTGALLALPPAESTSSSTTVAPSLPGAVTATVRVEVADFSFGEPRTATPGAVVEVANADAAAHTLTASGGAFDSGVVEQGAVGSFVAPAEPGTYDFYCEIHPSMTGSLVVG